jgi:hypothetical protein
MPDHGQRRFGFSARSVSPDLAAVLLIVDLAIALAAFNLHAGGALAISSGFELRDQPCVRTSDSASPLCPGFVVSGSNSLQNGDFNRLGS